MARAEISAGVCGFNTVVEATPDRKNPYQIHLTIDSECESVNKLASKIADVDAFREIAYRREPQVLALAPQCLKHPACPVPSGIIKAIEVAAGLALPTEAKIKLSK